MLPSSDLFAVDSLPLSGGEMPRFSIMPMPGETINIKKHPRFTSQPGQAKMFEKSLLEHTGFGKKKTGFDWKKLVLCVRN
jgi:hypothetical protein